MSESAPVTDTGPETADAPAPTPWGLRVGLGSVGLAFAIYFVGALMLGVVIQAFDPGGYNHRYLEYTAIGYQCLTFGVLVSALVLVLGRYALTPRSLGFHFPGWTALGLAALAVIPVVVGTSILQSLLNHVLPGAPLHGNAREVFPPGSLHIVPWERIVIALFMAVEVPLTEETLFRGILYQGARTFFHRWMPYQVAVACAALLSGVLFGMAHLLGDLQAIHTLPVLVLLGMVLAYVFERTRSVYASGTIHGLNNLLAVIAVFWGLH